MKTTTTIIASVIALTLTVPAFAQTAAAPSPSPVTATTDSTTGVRIKDLVRIDGLRENQLTGLGLVTGLAGAGDSANNPMLQYVLASFAGHLGIPIASDQWKSKNAAVVTVTCTLPAYVSPGDALDVQIASLGDAKNLEGGILLQTPLLASNGKTYAVAQGKLTTDATKGATKTTARVARGAIAEKAVTSEFVQNRSLSFLLHRPDFTTAQKIGQTMTKAFPSAKVQLVDSSRILVVFPEGSTINPADAIASVETLRVVPDFGAKVVINRTSGVVVAGREVQIAKVAVSVRGAKVTIGKDAKSNQTREQFLLPESTTVENLVTILQQIGLSTDVVVQVFQAIDQAGALYGQLEITDR